MEGDNAADFVYVFYCAFSINIGQELVWAVGPICRARLSCTLQPVMNGWSRVCLSALRCLSQFLSYGKERIQLFMTL